MRPVMSWRRSALEAAARWLTRQRNSRGQMAVVFLVIIALIFVLAAMTMNLGEVARLRTSTANAADAGALAAASWVASGENQVANIARGMWTLVLMVQAIFVVPFCFYMCWFALVIWGILWLANGLYLKGQADAVMGAAWDNAHAAALFTAIQNATIDDPTGAVQTQIKTLSDQFEATRTVPPIVRLDWVRKGAGGVPEPSWAEFNVAFTNGQPKLEMKGWAPSFTCLTPCLVWLAISNVPVECWWGDPNCCVCLCIIIPPWIYWCPGCIIPCFETFAWTGVGEQIPVIDPEYSSVPVTGAFREPGWYEVAGMKLWPKGGDCEFCLPVRVSVRFLNVTPSDMNNEAGDVIVRVTHHREGGTGLRFWETRYPDQIASEATAHYNGSSVTLWPDPRSFAQLVNVR